MKRILSLETRRGKVIHMPTDVVYRHGRHAANQSMCQKAPVAVYEARTHEEALDQAWTDAREGRVTVYANQSLRVVPKSQLSTRQFADAAEHDAMETQLLEPSEVSCCLCGRRPTVPIMAGQAQWYRCPSHT